MPKGPKPPKSHGFSHGLNLYQIFSYTLLFSKIFLFQYFLASNFVSSMQIFLSFVYYASTISVIVSGFLATICDPTDEIVKLERKAKLEGQPFETSRYEFHCEYCATSVSQSDTKHCRSCGRCVDGFDHHCEWVNNCISKKNYRSFAILIGSLGVSTLTFVVSGTIFSIDYFTNKLGVIDELDEVKDEMKIWHVYVIIVYTLISCILMLLDCKLVSFHLYLYRHNMTTYEYIIEGREKQREKSSKKRSSLTINKGKGKNVQKESLPQEIEDIKDVSIHEREDRKTGDKVRLVNSLPFNKLNYGSQDNYEEAGSPTHDAKTVFSNSNSSAAHFMLDKSAKVSDRSAYNDSPKKHLIGREFSFNIDIKAEIKIDGIGETLNSNKRFLSPANKNFSSIASPTQTPIMFPNFVSPSNAGLLASSYPEMQADDRRDSKEFDETEPPYSAKGEGFELRHVALSVAKIADNYVPEYGKISEEEENESELPNLSEVVQDFEAKGI